MVKDNTKKAQRAQITLGDILINVYLMPDGTYKLAGKNVTDAIGVQHKSLVESMGVRSLKALPNADLSLGDKSGSVKSETGESFIPVSLEDAITYWVKMAEKSNAHAIAILAACAIEALERRADSAFGKLRTEDERNQRLLLRKQRILARREWTDVVKDFQVAKGYYGTKQGSEEFKRLTVLVNLKLFGQPHFCCDRDMMTLEQQRVIESFETFLCRRANKCVTDDPYELVATTLELWV
jgi:hypothetical protein